MNFKPLIRCVTPLLLGAVIFASGCAVKGTEYSRSGLYAGASLIGAMPYFDDVGAIDIDDQEETAGVGLRAGYRFFNRFAVEASYETFQDFEFDVSDVELEAIHLTGKFYPLTGILQPYGLLGVGTLDSDISMSSFDESDPLLRFGIGLEGYLTEKLPLFAELDYRLPEGDSDDLQFMTFQFGAIFRF